MILAFDTCLDGCSVALASGGDVLASAADRQARGQAERLVPMIADVLARAGVGGGDIAGIAVTTGPGSFTGARIGVAAARGLALAWERPALGVTTLELLAFPARRSGMSAPLIACLPARDAQCFMQVIGATGEAESPPALVSGAEMAPYLDRAGATLCCPQPDRLPCPVGRARLAPQPAEPPAELLAALAREMPERRWRVSPAPVYARAPDARPSAAGRLQVALEGRA